MNKISCLAEVLSWFDVQWILSELCFVSKSFFKASKQAICMVDSLTILSSSLSIASTKVFNTKKITVLINSDIKQCKELFGKFNNLVIIVLKNIQDKAFSLNSIIPNKILEKLEKVVLHGIDVFKNGNFLLDHGSDLSKRNLLVNNENYGDANEKDINNGCFKFLLKIIDKKNRGFLLNPCHSPYTELTIVKNGNFDERMSLIKKIDCRSVYNGYNELKKHFHTSEISQLRSINLGRISIYDFINYTEYKHAKNLNKLAIYLRSYNMNFGKLPEVKNNIFNSLNNHAALVKLTLGLAYMSPTQLFSFAFELIGNVYCHPTIIFLNGINIKKIMKRELTTLVVISDTNKDVFILTIFLYLILYQQLLDIKFVNISSKIQPKYFGIECLIKNSASHRFIGEYIKMFNSSSSPPEKKLSEFLIILLNNPFVQKIISKKLYGSKIYREFKLINIEDYPYFIKLADDLDKWINNKANSNSQIINQTRYLSFAFESMHDTITSIIDISSSFIAIGTSSGMIKIYNLDYDCVKMIKAHDDAVRCLCFLGKTLVSGGDDSYIKIWNFYDYSLKESHRLGDPVHCVKLNSNGIIFSISEPNGVCVWEKTPKHIATVNRMSSFLIQNNILVCLTVTRKIIIWDVSANTEIDVGISHDMVFNAYSLYGDLVFCAFCDGNMIIASVKNRKIMRIVDCEKVTCIAVFNGLVHLWCEIGMVKIVNHNGDWIIECYIQPSYGLVYFVKPYCVLYNLHKRKGNLAIIHSERNNELEIKDVTFCPFS